MTIGESVTTIGERAYYDCSNLTSIVSLNPTPPKCGDEAFNTFTATLNVPQGSVIQYKAADVWRNFVVVREITDGTDTYLTINDGAHGSVKLKMDEAKPYVTLLFEAEDGWHVHSVSLNGDNVTAEVAADGTYTTPTITANSILNVVYAQGASSAPSLNDNQIQISAFGESLAIRGTKGGERIAVYTLDGKTIASVTGQKEKTELSLPGSGTYIIKVNGSVYKVAL